MGSAELILGGGLLLAAYSVYSFVMALMSNNTDRDVLSWASGNEPVKSKSGLINMARPLVHNFTIKYALKIKNPRYRKNLESLMLTAGLSKELNVDEFIGLQIFLGVFFPGFLAVMNFALSLGLPWLLVMLIVPMGIYYPQMYAKSEKTRRGNACRKDLPFFADLLALSTQAGSDFVGAIKRLVDKAPEGNVLASELEIVLKDITLGSSREDAFRGLNKRVETPEITSFVAVLIDAFATGASIAQVLKDQSVQIRLERFVRAEKAGAKASQLILMPMVLFIVPAVFLVVLGPVALSFVAKK